MASIFKRGGKKAPRDAPWLVCYSVRPGVRKTVQGCTDYEATKALARKLEADVMLRREGVIDERADKWADAEARPLREHVADWAAALRAAGRTEKHVRLVRSRVERLLDDTGAARISQLAPAAFQAAVGRRHEAEKLSLQTCTHLVRAVKQFSKWLWQEGRARVDALAPLHGFNAEQDRRRVRRELRDRELTALLHAAYAGPTVLSVPGPDRFTLYVLGVTTGLRAAELRSLTPESFDLNAVPPAVVVEARRSKRRKRDVQPLPRQVAEHLRGWLADKPSGKRCFPFPADKAAKMMQQDLGAARETWRAEAPTAEEREARGRSDFLRYRDKAGHVADFHSLRHTFVSRLVRSGVNPKVAQRLARHSTPVLTLGRYAHCELADGAAALERVPSLLAGPADRVAGGSRTAHGTAPVLLGVPEGVMECPNVALDNRGGDSVSSRVAVGTCRDLALADTDRRTESARSSAGQSGGFLNRRSEVRVLSGVPAHRERRTEPGSWAR